MSEGPGNADEADEDVLRVLALIRRQKQEKEKQSQARERARRRYPHFEKIRERAARAIAPLKANR